MRLSVDAKLEFIIDKPINDKLENFYCHCCFNIEIN
jgi:hypothetical protein